MVLNKVLRRLMADKGIKPASLARSLHIPATTISNWLQGQKPRDIEQVRTVAKFFGVSVEYLCFGEEPVQADPITHKWEEINAGVFEVVLRRVRKS